MRFVLSIDVERHVREFAGLGGVQGGVAGDTFDAVVCVEVLVEGDLEDGSGSLAE